MSCVRTQAAGCLVTAPHPPPLTTKTLKDIAALSDPQFSSLQGGGTWELLGVQLGWHEVGTIQTFFSQPLASGKPDSE